MQCLKVSQVPKERRGALTLKGTPIHFTEQRTGLGIRQMFLCPHCGAERLKLFYTDGAFRCAGCLRNDPYRHRRNLYDNGGEKLITYKMQRLAATMGITIKWPFDYTDYPFNRPKYMRHEKWLFLLKQLQAMEGMRFAAILGTRYSATEINQRISPEALANESLFDLRKYLPISQAQFEEWRRML